jgi:hypothetical protein
MLRNRQLSGGLIMFFFQFLTQAGLFFVVPLYLSVCLGLSALATGARLLPLSVTLLIAAIGIPRLFPNVSPRLVVRSGLLALLLGTIVLLGAFDTDAGPERDARIKGLKSALAILSLLVLVALFYAQQIPSTQPGAAHDPEPAPA